MKRNRNLLLAAGVPTAEPIRAPSRPRRRITPAPALTAPRLSPQQFEGAAFDGLLFSHHYQAPRGKEGAPLAMLPIWSPVAAPPLETMTLAQIVYRCLASVREPFRRSRLMLPRPEVARSTYTEVLRWALDWARSSVGASVVPIALSLRRLSESAPRLVELAERLRRQRKEQEISQRALLLAGCREILELGTVAPMPGAADLAIALETGNAWILLEDDRDDDGETSHGKAKLKDSKAKLKDIRRAFDLVFGVSGLSHAAILVVTARYDCNVLSDVQTFRLEQPQEPAPAPAAAGALPGSFARKVCRWTAYWGTPSIKVALVASAVVALGLLAFAVSSYDFLLELKAASGQAASDSAAAKPGKLLISLPVVLFGLLPMIIGYIWGLAYGSEEVRRSAVEVMVTSMFGFFATFLALLPKSMEPGLWRSTCVFLAALPGSALLGLAVVMMTSLFANVVWLLLSVRISRRLTTAALHQLAGRFRLVLHVAHHRAALPLPRRLGADELLPLLISFRQQELVPRALSAFPQLAENVRRAIFLGLKGSYQERQTHTGSFDYACSSLLISSLLRSEAAACKQCLRAVASDCVVNWPERKEFSEYHQPSTTFRMNALEYAARYLCYLTNLEELIVVR